MQRSTLMRFVVSTFVFCLLLATGCAPRPAAGPPATQVPNPLDVDNGPPPEDIISGVGTIVYQDLEGGFYGLIADDSTQYNPINLDERFQQDSLRVRFRALRRTDVMTTRMWGVTIEILEMLTL